MTQITHINADEMRALQGMSLEAKTLYVFELRRYADENGVTGLVRRHSYQSFREQLTVVPDWGSKQARQPEITEKKIRVILAELERHGLIEKAGANLVFRLPMSARDESVQKRKGGGRAAIGAEGRAETNATAAMVSGKGWAEGRADENAEEGRTSPVTINNNYVSNARGNSGSVVPLKRPVPADYKPSRAVLSWCIHRGYGEPAPYLDHFINTCHANGYQYADFDAAFKNAIDKDWAGVRSQRAGSGKQRSSVPDNSDTSWLTDDLLEDATK